MAALIAVLATIPRMFFLDVPFERDEGTYAYIADIINRGGLPYLDAFDHKPPAVYYLYCLAFRLFGHTVASPRLLAALFLATAGIALFLLVRRMTHRLLPAVFATLLFGLATASPAYTGFNANTEIFTLPFLVWGMWFLADDEPPTLNYALAGLLFGMGTMIKQPLAVVACALFACKGAALLRAPRRLALNALAAGASMIIPFALFALYFAAKGGFAAFWRDAFSYNFGYVAVLSWRQSMPILDIAMKGILHLDPFTWIAGLVGGAVFLAGRARIAQKCYLLAGTVGAAFATMAGKYYFGHYFIFLLPFLSAAAGLGLASVMESWLSRVSVIGAALVVLASGFVLTPFLTMPHRNLLHLCYGITPFFQSVELAHHLKSTSPPHSTAYIIGAEPQILFYSGFTSPTRTFYAYPLVMPTRYLSRLREEVFADLERHPPDYVIIVNRFSPFAANSPQGYEFLSRLFGFFAPYRLTAVSAYDPSRLIIDGNELHDRGLLMHVGSLLVFKRPSGAATTGSITFGGLMRIHPIKPG